jgi:hypothetical protein
MTIWSSAIAKDVEMRDLSSDHAKRRLEDVEDIRKSNRLVGALVS